MGRVQHTVIIQFDTKADQSRIPEELSVLARGKGFVRARTTMDAGEFGRLRVMLRKLYPNAVIRSLS